MNKLIQVRVADLLIRYPETKDNDRELITRYWKVEIWEEQDEARGKLQSLPYYSLDSFLAAFTDGKFTHPDTITRARRLVQSKYPHLRGEKYKARMDKQKEVKKELGYGSTMDESGNGFTP
jgi:hypothetical protein